MTSPDTARSALTLRLVLAAFGLLSCLVLGVLALRADAVLPATVLLVLAAVAAVDLLQILRRRAERAREHAAVGHRHDSLFE